MLIDSVKDSHGKGAVVSFLNDIFAESYFIGSFCIQHLYEHISGENFIDFGTPVLGEAGNGKADKEDKAEKSAYHRNRFQGIQNTLL
jgi:hypothetical protein